MMKTTQTNGHDLKRLCHLLNTMIEHLDSAPPESALGGIAQYEDEAAELIDSMGLAEEAGIPAELRPVIQRKEGGHDKKGTEEFAKLVEEAGIVEKAEFPEEGFPTCVAFRYVTTDCHVSAAWFNWHAASGLGLGPELDPPRGYKRVKPPPGHPLAELVSSTGPPPLEPDERYIRGFVACLKGWRARCGWNLDANKLRLRNCEDPGQWKPRDGFVAAKAVFANDGKPVSRQTVQGWIETDHPDVDRDPTTGAVWVDGEWLRGRLTKYRRRGT